MIVSSCLFCPNGRNTVYIAPIIIAVCFLFISQIIAIIVHGGGGERRIVGADVDCRPFFRCASVINTLSFGAFIERIISDTCYTVGNDYACKHTAPPESIIADARYAVWNGDARKRSTITERKTADVRHTIWEGDTRKTSAAIERRIPDARYAVSNSHAH